MLFNNKSIQVKTGACFLNLCKKFEKDDAWTWLNSHSTYDEIALIFKTSASHLGEIPDEVVKKAIISAAKKFIPLRRWLEAHSVPLRQTQKNIVTPSALNKTKLLEPQPQHTAYDIPWRPKSKYSTPATPTSQNFSALAAEHQTATKKPIQKLSANLKSHKHKQSPHRKSFPPTNIAAAAAYQGQHLRLLPGGNVGSDFNDILMAASYSSRQQVSAALQSVRYKGEAERGPVHFPPASGHTQTRVMYGNGNNVYQQHQAAVNSVHIPQQASVTHLQQMQQLLQKQLSYNHASSLDTQQQQQQKISPKQPLKHFRQEENDVLEIYSTMFQGDFNQPKTGTPVQQSKQDFLLALLQQQNQQTQRETPTTTTKQPISELENFLLKTALNTVGPLDTKNITEQLSSSPSSYLNLSPDLTENQTSPQTPPTATKRIITFDHSISPMLPNINESSDLVFAAPAVAKRRNYFQNPNREYVLGQRFSWGGGKATAEQMKMCEFVPFSDVKVGCFSNEKWEAGWRRGWNKSLTAKMFLVEETKMRALESGCLSGGGDEIEDLEVGGFGGLVDVFVGDVFDVGGFL